MAQGGPIFIGGLGRSGKTWMRFILSSHPAFALSRRTNLWTRHYKRYGDLKQRENFERCLAALLQSKHVQVLHPNAERVRREFWQGEASYARLFALLHEHYAEYCHKPRWGDQTELIEACADFVFAAYPDAKMIHMVRDPRDRYEAASARSSKQKGRAADATARWLYSVHLAERNSKCYPDRYMVVRYESLASQPQKTVAAVCAFLGEEYMPEMLLMKDVPRFKQWGLKGRSPLTSAYIDTYRGVLSEQEIALIQKLAAREMRTFGYALEPLHSSLGELLSYTLFKAPVTYLRTRLWRALVAGHS